jgi:hypothetical protein
MNDEQIDALVPLPTASATGLGDEYESFDRDGRSMGKAYANIDYFTAEQLIADRRAAVHAALVAVQATSAPDEPADPAEIERHRAGHAITVIDLMDDYAEADEETRAGIAAKIIEALTPEVALTAEPVMWQYELATAVEPDGTYVDWRWHCTSSKPCVPEGSIRNLRPLVYG